METRIWLNGGYKNIKPDAPVKTTRTIQSFCVFNNLRNSLLKSQGGWYKLRKDGTLQLVTRTLYLISFSDLFKILSD